MRKILFLLLSVVFIIIVSFRYKPADDVVNYLNTPNVISYNKKDYKLVWSSHPASNYYKQEYIPKHQSVDHFDDMLLVDFLMIDTPAANIVGVKVNEIRERKKTDMVANYKVQVNKDKGEYLLDFILSEGDGRTTNTVEWNAYRYKNYADKAGHKGILLFGVSKRAYGDDVTSFLTDLKTARIYLLQTFTQYDFPAVEVK
jgi:hypothetical protein